MNTFTMGVPVTPRFNSALIWILQMESYQLVVIALIHYYSHCIWMNMHVDFHSSYITVTIIQFLHYCCENCLVFMCPLYVVKLHV